MTPWRFVVSAPAPGDWNMALDHALAAAMIPSAAPVLRCFAWTPPTVSIGHMQVVEEAVNGAGCREAGIGIVRRPTGGRALLHDQELTYSVSFSTCHSAFPNSLIGSYDAIELGLRTALRILGIESDPPDVKVPLSIKPREEAGALPSCFVSPARHDLRVGGRKLVGSAQVRTRDFVLQHGSLWIDADRNRLAQVLPGGAVAADRVMRGTTTLRELLGEAPRWANVADALRTGFERAFHVSLLPSEPTAEELSRAATLRETLYAHPQRSAAPAN